MANWELQLIGSVVRDAERPKLFTEAMENGLSTKTFSNPEAKLCWSQITLHYNRPNDFGHVPSEALLLEKFPNLDLPEAQEPFRDLCRLVKSKHSDQQVELAFENYLNTKDDDQSKAFTELVTAVMSLQEQATAQSDHIFNQDALVGILEEIEAIESGEGLIGMPFPWEPLNKATGGLNPGDYVLIYALPKSMKTWLGLVIALHLAQTGRKVLIYSNEMTWEKMRARAACILGKANYGRYRKGELLNREKELMFSALEEFLEKYSGNIVFTDARRPDGGPGGPNEIQRKLQVYQPDMIMLDSAYMLEMPGQNVNPYDWKSLAYVNRQLKQIAKNTKVPIVAIFQENERAAIKYKGTRGTASMAMNTSAIQDCDLSIRCVYNKRTQEISLHLPAARETTFDGLTINAKPGEDFSYAHDHLWEVGDDQKEEDEDQAAAKKATSATQKLGGLMDKFTRGAT